MKRRDFFRCGGFLMGSAAAMARQANARPVVLSAARPSLDIDETTIADLRSGMQSGRLTARSIVQAYIKRIEKLDKRGPAVNAVIEINPDALAIADALDGERRARGARGPLHGIPVLIKDNIDTADQMHTTAGSLALAGSPPERDAFLVRKLREAGAVILGKTNLSEWANFRSTRSTSGWSGRGGFTRNPYATDRNPSGSSSGSAVAVAANFCAVAVGTETDGSIVSPSSANGIVGIKPTLGLISRTGIIPIAHSQDTAGPMARTVADAAELLGVLAGADPADPATAVQRGKSHPDYPRFLDRNGLRGARIGVARNLMDYHNAVDALMEKAIASMKNQGAVIIDPVDIPNLKSIGAPEFEVLLYEFKHDLNAYLAARGKGESPRSLDDLIEYNNKNAAEEMPFFGQEIFLKAKDKGPLTDPKYLKALKTARRCSRQEGIDAVLRRHRLDAIAAPTDAPPWLTDPVNGDHFLGGCSTVPAVAGYPHITVPMGNVSGLPVGISFFAGAWSEPTLLKIAFAFEQATKARRPPRFLPRAELG